MLRAISACVFACVLRVLLAHICPNRGTLRARSWGFALSLPCSVAPSQVAPKLDEGRRHWLESFFFSKAGLDRQAVKILLNDPEMQSRFCKHADAMTTHGARGSATRSRVKVQAAVRSDRRSEAEEVALDRENDEAASSAGVKRGTPCPECRTMVKGLARRTHRTAPKPDEQCPICLDQLLADLPESELATLPCHHMCCLKCWQGCKKAKLQ